MGQSENIIDKNEIGAIDEIISGVSNHGFIVPLTAQTIDDLCLQLNEFKTPYSLKTIVWGDNRFHAILELDRKIKKVKIKQK